MHLGLKSRSGQRQEQEFGDLIIIAIRITLLVSEYIYPCFQHLKTRLQGCLTIYVYLGHSEFNLFIIYLSYIMVITLKK